MYDFIHDNLFAAKMGAIVGFFYGLLRVDVSDPLETLLGKIGIAILLGLCTGAASECAKIFIRRKLEKDDKG